MVVQVKLVLSFTDIEPLKSRLAQYLLKNNMNSKLYVGNLPYSTTDSSLGDLFASVGTVTSASVITDKMSGRSKGFGFVEMSTPEEAAAAIEKFHGQDYEGRAMTVSEARPKEDRPQRDFGGDRGGNRSW